MHFDARGKRLAAGAKEPKRSRKETRRARGTLDQEVNLGGWKVEWSDHGRARAEVRQTIPLRTVTERRPPPGYDGVSHSVGGQAIETADQAAPVRRAPATRRLTHVA